MKNHIEDVAKVEKEMKLGWAHGTGEAHRYIPALLTRIKELEFALTPFAKVAVSEKANPNYNSNSLVHVRLSDCETALDMCDSRNSIQKPRDDFFDLPV